ncbi:MAG: hypothetical protein JO197_22120 [Acidobacteria bacterium]|nr:hypothetical protein [Acidobacteriota bacterium]MBV9474834.1 hypothetical protein [Acidobacteriota bacterium]
MAVVLDSNYASSLGALAFRTPVWIVDTPPNRAAAEEAWRSAVEWPHITVTLFRDPGAHPTKDDWRALIEQLVLHEGALDTVDVLGSAVTLPSRAALAEAGFTRFDETRDGFRARRA